MALNTHILILNIMDKNTDVRHPTSINTTTLSITDLNNSCNTALNTNIKHNINHYFSFIKTF